MRFVKTLELGMMLAAAATSVHAQAKPTGSAGTGTTPSSAVKPAVQPVKSTEKTPAKPIPQTAAKSNAPAATAQPVAKPSAQAPAAQPKPGSPAPSKPAAAGKPAAPATTKPAAPKMAVKTSPQAAKPTVKKASPKAVKSKPAEGAAVADKELKIAKRDPFESMVGRDRSAGGPVANLPPGKAGLQVSTLRLDGIVRAPSGMIAVVSNPQTRTYFLREGDQLYDGRVEKIAMDGVSFHEVGKDAFGKPVERQVNKRIYASAGEQQ
jgi:hypothetical protein